MTHQGGIANMHNGTTLEGLRNIFGFPSGDKPLTYPGQGIAIEEKSCLTFVDAVSNLVNQRVLSRKLPIVGADRKWREIAHLFSSSFGFLPIKGCRSTPRNKGC
jgi:hypothetical protein